MAKRVYSLTATQLIIAGYPISGYSSGGGIEVTYASDILTDEVGADGHVSVSHLEDPRAMASIKIAADAEASRILGSLLEQQMENVRAGNAIGYTFLLIDPATGDSISEQCALFKTRPSMTKQQAVGEREFVLLLPKAGNNTKIGANLTA